MMTFLSGSVEDESTSPEMFMIKNKYVSLLPAKNNSVLVVSSADLP